MATWQREVTDHVYSLEQHWIIRLQGLSYLDTKHHSHPRLHSSVSRYTCWGLRLLPRQPVFPLPVFPSSATDTEPVLSSHFPPELQQPPAALVNSRTFFGPHHGLSVPLHGSLPFFILVDFAHPSLFHTSTCSSEPLFQSPLEYYHTSFQSLPDAHLLFKMPIKKVFYMSSKCLQLSIAYGISGTLFGDLSFIFTFTFGELDILSEGILNKFLWHHILCKY